MAELETLQDLKAKREAAARANRRMALLRGRTERLKAAFPELSYQEKGSDSASAKPSRAVTVMKDEAAEEDEGEDSEEEQEECGVVGSGLLGSLSPRDSLIMTTPSSHAAAGSSTFSDAALTKATEAAASILSSVVSVFRGTTIGREADVGEDLDDIDDGEDEDDVAGGEDEEEEEAGEDDDGVDQEESPSQGASETGVEPSAKGRTRCRGGGSGRKGPAKEKRQRIASPEPKHANGEAPADSQPPPAKRGRKPATPQPEAQPEAQPEGEADHDGSKAPAGARGVSSRHAALFKLLSALTCSLCIALGAQGRSRRGVR